MNQQRSNTVNLNQFKQGTGVLPSGGAYGMTPQPPPLPPRPSNALSSYRPNYMTGYGGYGGYGGYNNYGNNWGYGRYGSYGGFGSPYSSTYGQFGGPSGDVENRLIQFAEESSRPAFQSIESIIHTFSSITMMLESTFFAMTSSFRAILGVAENVGRVRSMFGQLLSTFALIRFLKWMYRKIMFTLGLSPTDPNDEKLWQKTVYEVLNREKKGPSTWPILLFLSLLIAIPYLISKLVNNINQARENENNPKEWFKYNEPVYSATANYDFIAATPDEMSLKAGQKIWLAPQSLQPKHLPGWSKATDRVNVGLVPLNYITIVGQLMKKIDVENTQVTPPTTENELEENYKDANIENQINQETTN
ncbi:peroxisomal membrane protein PEX13-like [Chelonus insularis]|uniref:peroxisomal membrane protein PEX13-like n=1 Tax=Chelonus insularis TaxID=460826 RepID=UPI00158F2DF3|nr:peroxisomal membrane protein PEX13-like [Chelonus insularis]